MTEQQQKTQLEKFKEAARKLDCDDNESHFDERLRKLVNPPE
jgi:hypothetical protein